MSVVNKKVLALNSAWLPVDIITVRDAFRLVCKENAKILETSNESYMLHGLQSWIDIHMTDSYSTINTVSLEIAVPEVVVMTHYDEVPRQSIVFSKENLLIRDHYRCVYCQIDLTLDTMTIDHVIPSCKGGGTSWENCVTSCSDCNREKAHHLPSGRFKLKNKPKEPTAVGVLYNINKKFDDKDIPESWKKFLFRK